MLSPRLQNRINDVLKGTTGKKLQEIFDDVVKELCENAMRELLNTSNPTLEALYKTKGMQEGIELFATTLINNKIQ